MRCNSVLVIVMFCLVLLVKGPFYCGLKINHLDMSINFAGILMAMTNGAGALSGMASSFLIKQITKDVRHILLHTKFESKQIKMSLCV